jgi:hypothetical protein
MIALLWIVIAALSLFVAWRIRADAPAPVRAFLDSQSLIFWGVMAAIVAALLVGLN